MICRMKKCDVQLQRFDPQTSKFYLEQIVLAATTTRCFGNMWKLLLEIKLLNMKYYV